MEEKNVDFMEIDLKEIFYIWVHKLWIVILVGIFCSLSLGLYNKYIKTPVYESKTSFYVIHRQDESKTTISDLQTGRHLTQDYMILITSRPVLEKVINITGVDITPEALESMIYINNPQESRILYISVMHKDPMTAKILVDAVAEVAAEQMCNIMETEKVNIVEYGNIPKKPYNQNIRRSFISGGIIGIILSSAVIIILYVINDNIRSAEDIEKHLGITVMGMIPTEVREDKKKRIKKRKVKEKMLRSSRLNHLKED